VARRGGAVLRRAPRRVPGARGRRLQPGVLPSARRRPRGRGGRLPPRVRTLTGRRPDVGGERQRPRLDQSRGRRDSRMTWAVTRVADVPKNGPHWRPVRLELGIEAFGVNSSHGNTGDLLVLEHDEALSGHEELYLVLAGRVRFEVNGEAIDAPAGTLVFVADPGARRRGV